jgi:hypothetical protein
MRLCLVCLSLNGLKDSDRDTRTLKKWSKEWMAVNCSKSGNSYSSWSSDNRLLNDSKIMRDQLHINLEASRHILWSFRKEEDLHKVYSTQSHRWDHSAMKVKRLMAANCHAVEISHLPYSSDLEQANFFLFHTLKEILYTSYFLPWSST